jgi:hypothetical protein
MSWILSLSRHCGEGYPSRVQVQEPMVLKPHPIPLPAGIPATLFIEGRGGSFYCMWGVQQHSRPPVLLVLAGKTTHSL